jgi:hypothetical protein
MRIFLIGLVIIFLVSMLLGQLLTPRRTPFRKVFAKGLYFTLIGMLIFGAGLAVWLIVYESSTAKGSLTQYERMNKEQRETYRDSLRMHPPSPSLKELKSKFVEFDFQAVLIPCYETVHKFGVASLKEIEFLEKIDEAQTDGIYEIRTRGEFKTNKPVSGFHVRGTFVVQYEFYRGDSDIEPGWKFNKILISKCEVLAAEGEPKEPSSQELYPDLPRSQGS